jgi:hypothetical protein
MVTRAKTAVLGALAALALGAIAGRAAAEPCNGLCGLEWQFGASTSYNYDFNSPDAASLNTATYSNLEQDESFNIDLVQLGVTGQRGRVGFGAKLDYGDLTAFAGDSDDGDVALQEAYLTYDADGVGGMAGRFGTPIGFEVLEPWGNAHASRSWAWTAQPINHDGVTLNGSADVVDVMIGLVNNFTVNDPLANDLDDEKGVIGSIGAGVSDALNFYFAGIYTEEDDTVDIGALNAIVSGDIDVVERSLRYAIEAYWRRDDPDGGDDLDLWSVVGYVGADIGGPFAFDLRIEYADDEGIVLGDDSDVISATPTLSVHVVEGVDLRVEYRFDKAGEDVFLDDSDPDDTLHSITGQLVWTPEL